MVHIQRNALKSWPSCAFWNESFIKTWVEPTKDQALEKFIAPIFSITKWKPVYRKGFTVAAHLTCWREAECWDVPQIDRWFIQHLLAFDVGLFLKLKQKRLMSTAWLSTYQGRRAFSYLTLVRFCDCVQEDQTSVFDVSDGVSVQACARVRVIFKVFLLGYFSIVGVQLSSRPGAVWSTYASVRLRDIKEWNCSLLCVCVRLLHVTQC